MSTLRVRGAPFSYLTELIPYIERTTAEHLSAEPFVLAPMYKVPSTFISWLVFGFWGISVNALIIALFRDLISYLINF